MTLGDILIVDDEADIRELVSGILEDENFLTRSVGDSNSALNLINRVTPSLVILDIWLEGSDIDGLQLLDKIIKEKPDLPVVMISGHGNIEAAVSAIKRGAYDFIEKPFNAERLLMVVKRAIETVNLRSENILLKQQSGKSDIILGNSNAISNTRASLEKVAPTGSRVLISGPPGSGKELAARLVHNKSKRSNGPFVVLNSARMSPETIDQELFGIEEGIEEPESPRRIGILEKAHKGTLFIDEVADMPMETQGRILRVLQDQSFYRVGGTTEVTVDIRVVSASSKDLFNQISEGKFREDLFHRLSVVPIKIPPLSERREDIPILAKSFMESTAQSIGFAPRIMSEDSIAVLQSRNWSGNVRELRNLIERLLIMAPGNSEEPIKPEMIPVDDIADNSQSFRHSGNGEVIAMPLKKAREFFEREYLITQISRFGGNISKTAEFVGMERSALHRKLKSLGISSSLRN
ncbi:MAG: sigma-54-dependent Fis family transcriptional regulator [Rhodospirillaceae bacterium]|nr:sigma-54-dependent Fis family transcriptional regulator [Rhodospirillaceae bacterium]|tara:strand:- start:16018 stop:17412 length:1395 start_codon:yes stop_codon:yes gene_type:complete